METGYRQIDFFTFPEGIHISRNIRYGITHFECEGKDGSYIGHPNCALVKLYAKLGLHRYNLLKATNFQLHRVKSFNMSLGTGVSAYYITLAACLPTTGLQQLFQVQVEEERLGILDLTCPISRLQVTESSNKELPSLRPHCEPVSTSDQVSLPPWPSSEIAFSDTKRFYMLKESELQNTDWFSLYVELAICTSSRHIRACHLGKFKWEIVQVAVETLDDMEPPRLDLKTAVAYIVYKDLVKARIGKSCDYKAIVRRHFNETTGLLSIQGKFWRKKTIALSPEQPLEKPSKKKSAMLRRRLGIHRIWRLSNPRPYYHPYKKRGLGSS